MSLEFKTFEKHDEKIHIFQNKNLLKNPIQYVQHH